MSEPPAIPASRDMRLHGVESIGPDGLAKLRASRVAVIGLGNVGGAIAFHLGLLGLSIMLIDRDRVGIENLLTQGFSPDEVGRPKAVARADALRRLNPECHVEPIHASVESLGLGVLRGVHLILAAVDSFRARTAISEIALPLGLAWIDTAIDGTGHSYTARVAAFPGGPTGACLLCAHDQRSLATLARADGAPAGCPNWWGRQEPVTAPTLAVSSLGAAAAAASVTWGIEMLLGRGSRVAGREAHFDLFLTAMRSHRLPVNHACVADHRVLTLTPIGRPVEEVSVANTFRIAEAALGRDVTLRLNRRRLVTMLRCPTCDEARRPYRVLDAMTEDEARCRHGHGMEPLALGLRDRLDRHDLTAAMGKTWAELGLPSEDVVTAQGRDAELNLLFAQGRAPSAITPPRPEEDTR